MIARVQLLLNPISERTRANLQKDQGQTQAQMQVFMSAHFSKMLQTVGNTSIEAKQAFFPMCGRTNNVISVCTNSLRPQILRDTRSHKIKDRQCATAHMYDQAAAGWQQR